MDWPLGEGEGLRLEFKRAEALRKPSNVAREAVGFLNAEGGDIWIGVGETGGVADAVEAILEPDREIGRLQDGLIDLVEPAPAIGSEIVVEKVPFPGDRPGHLLLVKVKPGTRGPYALRQQGGRAFLKRSGSRLHEMTRQELAEAFSKGSGPTDRAQVVDEAARRLTSDLYAMTPRLAREGGMRVIVEPVGGDVALQLRRAELLPLLQEAKRTGNRPLGWNFTSNYSSLTPQPDDGYRFGEKDSVQWLEISRRGRLDFNTALERLTWRDEGSRLWPLALLELPISVARLARTLYANHASRPLAPGTSIILGLGLFGIGERTLSPGSPHSIAYQLPENARRTEVGELVTPPQTVLWSELHDSPDRCGYHLVRQVYRSFGFEEEQVPEEYDRERSQLTFPA